jgi:hypothetical protein
MKIHKITQQTMGDRLNIKGGQRQVQKRLSIEDWKVSSVIDFLDQMDYELVIKPKKRGKRPEGEILITKEDDSE